MKECTCNLSQRLVGDGCEVCNPELAKRYEDDARNDMAAEIRTLWSQGVTVQEIATHLEMDERHVLQVIGNADGEDVGEYVRATVRHGRRL